MNYSISISGMHCSGCQSLISLCLEELDFSNINVNLTNNSASFTASESQVVIAQKLTDKFNNELPQYKFSDLKVI